MNTLVALNFETATLPGLRVWSFTPRHWPERFAVVVQNEKGAVELWSAPNPMRRTESLGGVEVHSPKPAHGDDNAPEEDCTVLGGNCWGGGSSLAYLDTFLPLIQQGNVPAILHNLAAWHESNFGGAA